MLSQEYQWQSKSHPSITKLDRKMNVKINHLSKQNVLTDTLFFSSWRLALNHITKMQTDPCWNFSLENIFHVPNYKSMELFLLILAIIISYHSISQFILSGSLIKKILEGNNFLWISIHETFLKPWHLLEFKNIDFFFFFFQFRSGWGIINTVSNRSLTVIFVFLFETLLTSMITAYIFK